jgi:hypothetical protein
MSSKIVVTFFQVPMMSGKKFVTFFRPRKENKLMATFFRVM